MDTTLRKLAPIGTYNTLIGNLPLQIYHNFLDHINPTNYAALGTGIIVSLVDVKALSTQLDVSVTVFIHVRQDTII